jgi:hypothetical protein
MDRVHSEIGALRSVHQRVLAQALVDNVVWEPTHKHYDSASALERSDGSPAQSRIPRRLSQRRNRTTPHSLQEDPRRTRSGGGLSHRLIQPHRILNVHGRARDNRLNEYAVISRPLHTAFTCVSRWPLQTDTRGALESKTQPVIDRHSPSGTRGSVAKPIATGRTSQAVL